MRIAVFSDIHGNPYACEAVLESISRDVPFDVVVAAGDLCLGGSAPAKCVDLLREADVLSVFGNTDEYIFAPDKKPGDEQHLKHWNRILKTVGWVRPRLGEKRIQWLQNLPFSMQFGPTTNMKDALLIVHAQPKSQEGMIYAPPEEQIRLQNHVWQPDDDPELSWMMEGVEPRTIAFGHYHYTNFRKWRDYKLVNVSPCSQPAKDKDPRARYTIFEWQGESWEFTRRYVDYNYQLETRALERSGMPGWEDYVETFP